MSTRLPVLGVAAAGRAPDAVTRLLVGLRPWCRVSGDASVEAVAWLATSPHAPLLARLAASGRPLAIWVEDEREAHSAMGWHPVAVVTAGIGAAMEAPQDAVLVLPAPDSPLLRARPVPPFVRARRRSRQGLAEAMVADLGEPGSMQAIGVAAAVLAGGGQLLLALAHGAPTVTDAASAAAIGARHGIEVVVAGEDRLVAATALARDLRRAAELSRAGRLLAERRGADAGVAVKLARRLGLAAPPGRWRATLRAAMEELSAPPSAGIRARVERACAPLERGASGRVSAA